MKPGIYNDLTNEAYHASEGLSSSDLKQLLKSPSHWQAYKNGEKKRTKAKDHGNLVHVLLLEPDKFKDLFHVGEFNTRRGKEYDRACEEAGERLVISIAEHEQGLRMVDSVLIQAKENEELAKSLEGQKETSFYWIDEATGILCKVKPDILGERSITDIKTASDASFDAFQRDMVEYLYFLSAPYYIEGVSRALPRSPPIEQFKFVVIEKTAPYPVAIYKLSPEALSMGAKLFRKSLNSYAEAISTEIWGGYPKEAIEMGVPNYYSYKYSYSSGDPE